MNIKNLDTETLWKRYATVSINKPLSKEYWVVRKELERRLKEIKFLN